MLAYPKFVGLNEYSTYIHKDHSVVYIDSALIPEDTRAQNDKSVEIYKPRQYILRQR